ncbi:chemotaxis-specific protein-glutamate methyltransferase CheB [Methylobacterium planeticum]|uniref:Protein-glutamate methylesterase/protein-glutamine glutaminase n=1 Tax=Methylobacterium planeticum TaxID=2615211 RepID=A0A6N6MPV3_9HYPH|nr:chemotaxis-specific protein-glutamate methyltransferase CheB [Methylobacterium planeticum]KAB1072584.1 chemotaxis-specific protein-glutamate methyltransferase CheB [Methylobacterium planeticum]
MIRLLVVDDSALMRKLLGAVFAAQADFEVAVARDGVEALAMQAAFRPDVITLDVNMPGLDGLACLDRIMLERPCPVVMLSSRTAEGAEVTLDALGRGAVDFVAKPTGAISLAIEEFGPRLVQKVRAASKARLRPTHRLVERVRARHIGAPGPAPRQAVHHSAEGQARQVARRLGGIVLVGASTGGPPALDALLSELPGDFAWPIVVAQHMPGSFTGPLARRLDGLCALAVQEVTRPVVLEPGHVYIGRGDADVIITRRPAGLGAAPAPSHPDHPWHPSVDRLVETALAHVEADRIVGILMTGMGRDGARSMTEMRARGGVTLAEAEETSVVWGMPGELVRAGGASVVAPLDTLAAELLRLVP